MGCYNKGHSGTRGGFGSHEKSTKQQSIETTKCGQKVAKRNQTVVKLSCQK